MQPDPEPLTQINARPRVDPVTFEVLRHRLSMIVDEAAQVLRQVTGSPAASEVGDCNTSLMDAAGNCIVVGPLLISHAISCSHVVKFILANYASNPGIRSGDMFISNDPYCGTSHQNCVVVVAPVFKERQLLAWSGAGIHLGDVGGPVPGQVAVGAQSIFEEPTPMPPVRFVEGDIIRQDIQEDFLGRSRTPDANALDLRAMIAANLALRRRFLETVDRYRGDVVTRVLARIIEFTAVTVGERLQAIPDGTWSAQAFLDYDDRGTLNLYRCCLELSKAGGDMVLDFSGTSKQAPGVVNCSFGGLEITVIRVLLSMLSWDLPPCPTGIMQIYRIIAEPGTIIHATWPAGMTRATTSAMQTARELLTLTVARMLACSEKYADRVIAPCAGYSGLPDITGIDQRGNPFSAPLLDFSLSCGYGARSIRDGIHTAGVIGSPGASMANVELYEQRYPLLYLARREEIDTAGPGRFEGGSALCIMVTPHGTDRIPDVIFHTHGTYVPSTPGLHGGLPGSTNQLVVKRQTNIQELLKRGTIPTRVNQVRGEVEVWPGICRSQLSMGDVAYWINNGGGGYGDPLDRNLTQIERDLELGYISSDHAASMYAVVFSGGTNIDPEATRSNQEQTRTLRRLKATGPPVELRPSGNWQLKGLPGNPITDRILLVDHLGIISYACRCGAILGPADRDHREWLPRFNAACASAGPRCVNLIEHPPVMLRNYICPECGSLVEVDVVEAV